MNWSPEHYQWIKENSRSYESTEKEVSRILNYRWHMLTEREFRDQMVKMLDIFFNEYNYELSKQWLMDHESFLIKCVAAYVVTIFSLKALMYNRKPFDLQNPLIVWNAILAIFSIAGFVRLTPTFLKVIYDHGIQHTYTHVSEIQTNNIGGYWTF